MAVRLTRYWIKFDRGEAVRLPPGVSLGVGVTGLGREDALDMVRDRIFAGAQLPPIADVVEDVDVSTLDGNHVLPNMQPPVARGIWFPRGYV